ncbi:MAG: polymerase subunit gamma/tau [Thermoleophilaceae bacterium]|nr:polymerase subunit gamma/tau [Thermoleophilaceae bacterium]
MLSLYRRHRPRTFDEVVGQEHIVRTLRNAIELDKVHHAYLFVGSRGTGKTSLAKLLACALNAEGGPRIDFPPDDPAARSIMTGNSLDVVEMDAASNNSVDDIRELRENVGLAPMGGARRVYILDEAHMLSASAWNAFLKTLEEPPPHVVFVLATTEAHKVPATIIDRCHRFDFHRPTLQQIADVLGRVAAQEQIEVPDGALPLIARAATGSFRDALGTLEQLVTYGGKEIGLEDVLEILGVADAELVFDCADALAGHDPKAALLAVERLSASGRDITQFMRDLAAHLRHLFVVQTLGEVPESFAVTAEQTDRVAAQAGRVAQGEVVRAIDLLAAGLGAVKDGSDPRIQLELALLKAVQPQADLSLQALLFRIEQLERRLEQAGGAAAPAEPRAGGAPALPAEPRAAEPEREPQAASPTGATASARPPAPEPPPRAAEPPEPRVAAASHAGGAAAAAAVEPEPVEEPEPAPVAVAEAGSIDVERLKQLWPAVIDQVRSENAMVGACLEAARPLRIDGDRLTICFPVMGGFSRKTVDKNRELVQTSLRALTGCTFGLDYEMKDDEQGEPAPAGLTADELIERLKRDYGATEVFDDEPEQEA